MHLILLQKKVCFVNKTTRTSQATSNTSDLNFNVDIPQWNGASSSKKEDIGMHLCRGKTNVEIPNEEVKGKSCKLEEIKTPKCSIKSHVETVNEQIKGRISEEE